MLDAQTCEPMTHVDGRLEALTLDDTSQESSRKSISGTPLASVISFVSHPRNAVDETYPAPLVSLISLAAMVWTLTSLTSGSPPSLLTATIVGSVP